MRVVKIVTVLGARPQFVKAAAVSRAISESNRTAGRGDSRMQEVIVHTDQHYDHNMSSVFFEEMNIPRPNYHLGINSLSHGAMTGQMLEKIEKILMAERPDAVLVYGDTNTTLAGALAAVKLHLPVAHVEAGLRSFNRDMPEEHNRILTDHISTFLFCPTQNAMENLKHEGLVPIKGRAAVPGRSISAARSYIVGDVMLDAALYYKKQGRKTKHDFSQPFILATLHREENTDDPNRMKSILGAFCRISRRIPVVFPMHPRTKKVMKSAGLINGKERIRVIEPVSYFEMIHLLEKCALVMTDSGGLQKEAFFFRKPCVTLREETEWMELVENGFNLIAGARTKDIVDAVDRMIKKKLDFSAGLYGKGDAAEKIIEILKKNLR